MTAKTMVERPVEEPIAGSKVKVEDVKHLLDQLEKTWKSHCDRGLEVRYEMVTMLNRSLGSPTTRLPHGESVLGQAAEKLAVSESELSRMRWLAYLFRDVQSLKNDEPDCRSWTDFKRILPRLKPSNGKMGAARRTVRPQSAIRGIAKSIDNIFARIDRLDASPEVDHCKKLLEDLKTAVKACEDRMPVQVKANCKDEQPKTSGLVAA